MDSGVISVCVAVPPSMFYLRALPLTGAATDVLARQFHSQMPLARSLSQCPNGSPQLLRWLPLSAVRPARGPLGLLSRVRLLLPHRDLLQKHPSPLVRS